MKKVIELNPKGITPEELEEMKGLNRAYQEFKLRIADSEIMKSQAIDAIKALESRMGKFNNDLVEKYKVSEDTKIDMHTGEFKS
jgi:hypothetical protein